MNRRRFSRSLRLAPPLVDCRRISRQGGGRFGFSFVPDRGLASPLTAGILPENLRFPAEGGLGVALWDQWAAMLRELRGVGKLLVITRNEAAVIGHYRSYPDLAFCAGEERFAHGGGMAVDLGYWHRAQAREERHPDGYAYSVEVVDARKNPLHKVCLTVESDLPRFLEWVQNHQAAVFLTPPLPVAGAEPASSPMADRGGAVRSLLHALMENELPVRVAVGNEGLSQSHAFVFQEMREMGEWVFCAEAEAGCHFRPAAVADLVLEMCGCGGASWLRALCPQGRTLFILAPTLETDFSRWTRLTGHAVRACSS